MINCTVFCFQFECHCTISKICKIRLIGHFFIYAAELIEPSASKNATLLVPLWASQKSTAPMRSLAWSGISSQSMYSQSVSFTLENINMISSSVQFSSCSDVFWTGMTDRIWCIHRGILAATAGYSPNTNCHKNKNQAFFHMDVSRNFNFFSCFFKQIIPENYEEIYR